MPGSYGIERRRVAEDRVDDGPLRLDLPIVTQNVTTYTDAYDDCRGIYSGQFTCPDTASDCVWVVAGTPSVVLAASQVGHCKVTKGTSNIYNPGRLQTECAGTCTAATADHCTWTSYSGQSVQLW